MRKCLECNVVEDEYHFVLECNIYTDLRTQYLPNYYRCRPNMYKCVDLLNVENPTIIKKLFIYIKHLNCVQTITTISESDI